MFKDENERKIQTRSVIRFLHMQGMKAHDIQVSLQTVNPFYHLHLNTIYFWIDKFEKGEISVHDANRCGRSPTEGLKDKISAELEKCFFISAREMAEAIGVDKNTVTRVLREELFMTKMNYKWIPHNLSPDLKIKRVATAKRMLEILKTNQRWGNIYTGDETWVYLRNPRKSLWIKSGIKPPSMAKNKIGAKK